MPKKVSAMSHPEIRRGEEVPRGDESPIRWEESEVVEGEIKQRHTTREAH